MRATVALAVVACALLAGCTPTPRAAGEPNFVVPRSWPGVLPACMGEIPASAGPTEVEWQDGVVTVTLAVAGS